MDIHKELTRWQDFFIFETGKSDKETSDVGNLNIDPLNVFENYRKYS